MWASCAHDMELRLNVNHLTTLIQATEVSGLEVHVKIKVTHLLLRCLCWVFVCLFLLFNFFNNSFSKYLSEVAYMDVLGRINSCCKFGALILFIGCSGV
jgi:hypothetical protein